ncbi:hypothetical protein GGR57DRAFT_500110 [Xylariaceae sp. FL1272]|nr:hypothetical protein GGR57DRAFT_500110 [Xylariaceae sp. FL1272]
MRTYSLHPLQRGFPQKGVPGFYDMQRHSQIYQAAENIIAHYILQHQLGDSRLVVLAVARFYAKHTRRTRNTFPDSGTRVYLYCLSEFAEKYLIDGGTVLGIRSSEFSPEILFVPGSPEKLDTLDNYYIGYRLIYILNILVYFDPKRNLHTAVEIPGHFAHFARTVGDNPDIRDPPKLTTSLDTSPDTRYTARNVWITICMPGIIFASTEHQFLSMTYG